MFNILMMLYMVVLFVLLTPGVLLRLPARSSKVTSAIVHGLIFTVVLHFTSEMVMQLVN